MGEIGREKVRGGNRETERKVPTMWRHPSGLEGTSPPQLSYLLFSLLYPSTSTHPISSPPSIFTPRLFSYHLSLLLSSLVFTSTPLPHTFLPSTPPVSPPPLLLLSYPCPCHSLIKSVETHKLKLLKKLTNLWRRLQHPHPDLWRMKWKLRGIHHGVQDIWGLKKPPAKYVKS